MPQPPIPDELLHDTIAAWEAAGKNSKQTADALGIPRGTVDSRLFRARERGLLGPSAYKAPESHPKKDAEFTPPVLPDELPKASDLLARRKKDFARKRAYEDARRLITIPVTVDGPIGIAHFGDPHIDDDGTDTALLEEHVAIVNRTPGLFAANVGDLSNNWVGRLARLYGEQSTSAAEAWVLVEWLMGACRWMYVLGGNHDCWSGAGDPVKWIAKQQGTLYQWHGARIGVQLPTGRVIRINARHDFKGHSMWNTAHGPTKAAQMGWRDHILTCGHTHTSGYQHVKDPSTGLLTHVLRVGSYKTYDRYADEKGLPNQCAFVCPVTIIDGKYEDNDPRLVTTIFDPGEAAEFLTWKRSRKAA